MAKPLRTFKDVHSCPAPLRSLHQYWQSKRQGNALPTRDDIDPIELRSYLGRITLAERRGSELVYQLVGADLASEWGFESTGKRIVETVPASHRDTFVALYATVLTEACPVHATLPPPSRRESDLTIDKLFLPLSYDGRSVDMVLTYATKPRERRTEEP